MYNFVMAFVLCAVAYIIGDVVATLTKAWVPSVFVTAVVMLVGYWTVLPHDLVSDSMLIPFGSTIGIYLLITHMGTVFSLKQLIQQWKTIVVCLVGLTGMCLLSWFIGPLFMDKTLVIAGLPPLTGGIVAATTMQKAATDLGLETAAVFAIAMYCIQGFAGYPLTAICLQKEGRRLLKNYREGNVKMTDADRSAIVNATAATSASTGKTLIPPIPKKFDSAVLTLAKLGIVAWGATQLGALTGVSGAIWALVLGVFFTTIGFLDRNSLNKANSYGIVMFALMMYVFDGLKDCTPSMTGALPRRPPISTVSPTFLPGAGIRRTAVVLQLTMPMAASSAIMAEIVEAGVSPGTAIISSPTEQTQVMASSLSIQSVPALAAAIMPSSSDTGMNAPDSPPTEDEAITPPFFTASFSRASAAVVPWVPQVSRPISSRMRATLSPTAGVGARERSTMPNGVSRRADASWATS